jgi:chromosome segregation ATPase
VVEETAIPTPSPGVAPEPAAITVYQAEADAAALEIARIKQALQEKETALQALQKQSQIQQAGLVSQALEKEKQLKELKRQLEDRETALASLRSEIQSVKDASKAAAATGEISSEKEKDLQEKLQRLADEEKRLTALGQQIAQDQQKYQHAASEKESQLQELKRTLAEKETSLEDIQVQILQQKRDLDEMLRAQEQKALEESHKQGAQDSVAPQEPATHEPIVQTGQEQIQEPPVEAHKLNDRQRALIDKLRTVERITRKEYSDMLKISTPTAARDLKELLDRRILIAKGPLGPGRWYELNK